jgi:hypothetical protein
MVLKWYQNGSAIGFTFLSKGSAFSLPFNLPFVYLMVANGKIMEKGFWLRMNGEMVALPFSLRGIHKEPP